MNKGSFLNQKITQIDLAEESKKEKDMLKRIQKKFSTPEAVMGGVKESIAQARVNKMRTKVDNLYGRFFRTESYNLLMGNKVNEFLENKTTDRETTETPITKIKLVPKRVVTRNSVKRVDDNILTRPIKNVLLDKKHELILIPEREPALVYKSKSAKKSGVKETKIPAEQPKRNSISTRITPGAKKLTSSFGQPNDTSSPKKNQDQTATKASPYMFRGKTQLAQSHTLDSEAFEGLTLADQNAQAVKVYKQRVVKFHQLIDSKLNALPSYSERDAVECLYWNYYTPKAKEAKVLSDKQLIKMLAKKKRRKKPSNMGRQIRINKSEALIRKRAPEVLDAEEPSILVAKSPKQPFVIVPGSPSTGNSPRPMNQLSLGNPSYDRLQTSPPPISNRPIISKLAEFRPHPFSPRNQPPHLQMPLPPGLDSPQTRGSPLQLKHLLPEGLSSRPELDRLTLIRPLPSPRHQHFLPNSPAPYVGSNKPAPIPSVPRPSNPETGRLVLNHPLKTQKHDAAVRTLATQASPRSAGLSSTHLDQFASLPGPNSPLGLKNNLPARPTDPNTNPITTLNNPNATHNKRRLLLRKHTLPIESVKHDTEHLSKHKHKAGHRFLTEESGDQTGLPTGRKAAPPPFVFQRKTTVHF